MAIGQFASGFADAFGAARQGREKRKLRDVLPVAVSRNPESGAMADSSAAPAQSSGAPPRDPAGRQSYAMGVFNRLGWKPHAAAAIVGGLMQESGSRLDPNAVGDNGTAFGVAQVRGDRFAGLKRFASEQGTSWKDFDTQLAYVDWELRNSEVEAGRRLMAAESIEDAAFAMAGFERPRGWKGWGATDPSAIHGWSNRLGFAKKQFGVAAAFIKSGNAEMPDVDVADSTAYKRWTQGLGETERGVVDLVVGNGGTPSDSFAGMRSAAQPGADPAETLGAPTVGRGLAGFPAKPKQPGTTGSKLRDVLSAGLVGMGAAQSEPSIPSFDFSDQLAMAQRQAESGPLPRLGEEPPMSLRRLFG